MLGSPIALFEASVTRIYVHCTDINLFWACACPGWLLLIGSCPREKSCKKGCWWKSDLSTKTFLMKKRKSFQKMTRDSYVTLIQSVHKWANKEHGPAQSVDMLYKNVKYIILKRNICRVVSFLRKSLHHRDTETEAQSFLWEKTPLTTLLLRCKKTTCIVPFYMHPFSFLPCVGLFWSSCPTTKKGNFIILQTYPCHKKSQNGVPGKKWGHLSSVDHSVFGYI